MLVRKAVAFSILGAFVAFVGHGVATAEDTGAGEPLIDAAAAKTVSLAPKEQLEQANTFVAAMERIRETVSRELSEARNKKDVVKTLCLDDKLNQLDVALRKVTDRVKALEVAVERGDSELSGHEYTIISVLHQRALQLDAEARQCIGKEIVSVGDSDTKLEIEGDLPGEEQTTTFPTPPLITEPPTCASCFE